MALRLLCKGAFCVTKDSCLLLFLTRLAHSVQGFDSEMASRPVRPGSGLRTLRMDGLAPLPPLESSRLTPSPPPSQKPGPNDLAAQGRNLLAALEAMNLALPELDAAGAVDGPTGELMGQILFASSALAEALNSRGVTAVITGSGGGSTVASAGGGAGRPASGRAGGLFTARVFTRVWHSQIGVQQGSNMAKN